MIKVVRFLAGAHWLLVETKITMSNEWGKGKEAKNKQTTNHKLLKTNTRQSSKSKLIVNSSTYLNEVQLEAQFGAKVWVDLLKVGH